MDSCPILFHLIAGARATKCLCFLKYMQAPHPASPRWSVRSHPAARDKHSPLRLGMYASYPIPPRLDGPFLKDHNLFPLAQRAYSMGIIFPE